MRTKTVIMAVFFIGIKIDIGKENMSIKKIKIIQ